MVAIQVMIRAIGGVLLVQNPTLLLSWILFTFLSASNLLSTGHENCSWACLASRMWLGKCSLGDTGELDLEV